MKVFLFIATVIFALHRVEGLTCLQCKGVPKPRICNKVVECYAGESCSVEQVLNEFGEIVYNLGCLPNTVCNNFTSSINGHRVTCSECCNSKDLCNANGCSQQGYPEHRGPICYDCPLHTDKCHNIEFCSSGEMCNIVGKNMFSESVYTSSCISKHACKPVEGNHVAIIGKRDVIIDKRSHEQHICDLCCPDDLCNKNCTTAQLSTAIKDCSDIMHYGEDKGDGIYTIITWKTRETINVYCDMTTDGGGWTVFQYRFNGSVDFYRNFSQYENGFGNLHSEFWLGLKYIEEIANRGPTDLRIDLEAADGAKAYETFDHFSLSPGPAFTLHIGPTIASLNISNQTGFEYHNGMKFSAYDHDADTYYNTNCAVLKNGAWWYKTCEFANLNGGYNKPGKFHFDGIHDYSFDMANSLKTTKMMLRRHIH